MKKWYFFITGIGTALVLSWIFFDFSALSVVTLPLIPFIAHEMYKQQKEKEKWELNVAFKDGIMLFKHSLIAGYSPEAAMREATRELEKIYAGGHVIRREFEFILTQMSTGKTMEDALTEFGERSGVKDIVNFAECFLIVKRQGGNMCEAVQKTAGLIQDKIDVRREQRIIIANKRFEFKIMEIMPLAMILYLRLCAYNMVSMLYTTLAGRLFMLAAMAVYIAACAIGEYIIRGTAE